MTFQKTWVVAAALLSLAGCTCALQPRYDGLRCNPGNSCPGGFDCVREGVFDVCRARDAGGGNFCQGVTCDTPPASQCQDANTKRTFTGGSCDGATGQCVWTAQDTNCPQGCLGGLCTGDPCNGVSCSTPPAPTCLNATTLRTSANPGTCSGGTCSYTQTDVTCTNGCANNQCTNQNLCTGVTCNTPPQPACSGSNLVTYGVGTCNPGTGLCSYAQNVTSCPSGCANGRCNSAQLNFLWTQPQVRHQVTALDQAPASSGLRVLAVGPGGAVSVFNGSAWSRLSSNTTQALNAVWFCGTASALVVGENRTVLRYSVAANTLTAVNGVPTTNLGASLVGVHGMNCDDFILVDDRGGWARWRAAAWTSGTLSTASGPYRMRSVYVAPDQKTRIAGLCYSGTSTAKGCVAYNNPLGTSPTTWYEDQDNSANTTEGFMSVGPPTGLSTDAWVGTFPGALLKRHDAATGALATDGGVPDLTQQPAFSGSSGILGITGTSAAAGTRATFLLSGGNSTTPGYLWRATGTGLDPEASLELYFNVQSMGRTESGGVMVADARTQLSSSQANNPVVNDIFRRGANTYDAYDLAEDWVALDVGTFPVGTGGSNVSGLVLVSAYNDLAIRGGAMTRWYFQRGPYAQVQDMVAGNQFALVVGRSGTAYRFSVANGFQKVTTNTAQDLNAACRVTDSQMYVAGAGGVILSYTGGTSAVAMTTNTTKALYDVHCPTANSGVACGQDGTVLLFNGSTWSPASPAFSPGTAQLTSCRVDSAGTVWVAGDGAFARLQGGAWSTLASRSQLSDLLVRAPNDVYASSGSEIAWFNGTSWATAFTAAQPLWAGGQLGARVVYTGVSGVLVESQ